MRDKTGTSGKSNSTSKTSASELRFLFKSQFGYCELMHSVITKARFTKPHVSLIKPQQKLLKMMLAARLYGARSAGSVTQMRQLR